MFLKICVQTHSVVFALSRQINKQKFAKTINPLCAGNKLFVKYQAQGGVFTTNSTLCRPLTVLPLQQQWSHPVQQNVRS